MTRNKIEKTLFSVLVKMLAHACYCTPHILIITFLDLEVAMEMVKMGHTVTTNSNQLHRYEFIYLDIYI